MDSFLSFVMRAVGFDDLPPTSNPTRKGIDQKLSLQNIPVDNDQTQEFHLDPAGSVTVVDGLRTISVDASTAFDLTAIDAITYRLTWTGAGAAPVFRTDRAINLTGRTLDLGVPPSAVIVRLRLPETCCSSRASRPVTTRGPSTI